MPMKTFVFSDKYETWDVDGENRSDAISKIEVPSGEKYALKMWTEDEFENDDEPSYYIIVEETEYTEYSKKQFGPIETEWLPLWQNQ